MVSKIEEKDKIIVYLSGKISEMEIEIKSSNRWAEDCERGLKQSEAKLEAARKVINRLDGTGNSPPRQHAAWRLYSESFETFKSLDK